jgi:hypothetical protein
MSVRREALSMNYSEPDDLIGWRTNIWQPVNVRKLIEKAFQVKIDYWETDAAGSCNGVFFSAFSSGPRAERVKVHFDEPPDWLSLLVYLTPSAPHCAGTSFWRHRQTGLRSKPTRHDAQKLGISLKELEEIIERDGWYRNRWDEIDRVGNLFNRAVMFRAGLFHSATSHFGNNPQNGRLYHSFHFLSRARQR